WTRPKEEIMARIDLFREYLVDVENYKSENVKTKFIGDLSAFDDDIRKKIADCESDSENFTGLTLNIAMNYGGRDEIITAVKKISERVKNGEITTEQINEEMISQNLYTAGQPDVDLIIRPSGELRLSNFMLWQSAYAEYIFMDILWPDFNENSLDKALNEFSRRNRRYGGV
ncbi:MAG: polyprenyl diphosphate synthase, partial [Oscillospiraceae bacterium]